MAINIPSRNFATLILVFLSLFLNKHRTANSHDTPVAAPCRAIVATMTGVDMYLDLRYYNFIIIVLDQKEKEEKKKKEKCLIFFIF